MKVFEIINKNLRSPISLSFLKKTEEDKILPIITISREKNAGGLIIAEKLAKKLGKKWDYFHKDIVEKIALEAKVSKEKVEEIENKTAPYLQDLITNLFGNDGFDLSTYHKNLIKVLYEFGRRGHVIIVGRGANFIFNDALKVRIIAEKEHRVNMLVDYEKMTEKEAKKTVEVADKERDKFISNLYNKDITDPKNFDLVIKISPELSVEEAVDIIARVAKKRFKL